MVPYIYQALIHCYHLWINALSNHKSETVHQARYLINSLLIIWLPDCIMKHQKLCVCLWRNFNELLSSEAIKWEFGTISEQTEARVHKCNTSERSTQDKTIPFIKSLRYISTHKLRCLNNRMSLFFYFRIHCIWNELWSIWNELWSACFQWQGFYTNALWLSDIILIDTTGVYKIAVINWIFSWFICSTFNSLRPSGAYIPQEPRSSFVQIMACRLSGVKPSFEPMLPYCQLEPKENIAVKLWWISKVFIRGNALENIVCEIAAILCRPRCVNT